MHLTLVAPGLLALPATELAAVRSLARFARFARATRNDDGLATATLSALEAPELAPAPLLALGAGLDCLDGYLLAADPVTLVAGRNDVRLAGVVDDLDAVTAAALVARLNAHFRDDGLSFEAPRPAHWFVRLRSPPALTTTATDVVAGQPVFPYLPQGSDATIWRRWGDEIQMLLHATPEHTAREREGLNPVNGVWFWGGGMCGKVVAPALRAYVPADATGDLLRGLARSAAGEALALPPGFEAIAIESAHTALVLPAATTGTLPSLVEHWLAPAVAALEQGRLATLTLIATGDGVVTWVAARPRALARLTAAFGHLPFAVPARA